MSLMEIGALGGAVLCACFLVRCTLGSIKERIEKKRKEQERQEQSYRAAWSIWGDITALPRS